MYACGIRAGELLGLNLGDLDVMQATLFIQGKGGKQRIVPIHDQALDGLAIYLAKRRAQGKRLRSTTPLFVTHPNTKFPASRRMTQLDLEKVFWRIRKRWPGGKHVHPHLMRHTFAVHMLQGGADIRHVQVLLGHESPETTSRYLGLVKDDLKRVYDRAIEAILND